MHTLLASKLALARDAHILSRTDGLCLRAYDTRSLQWLAACLGYLGFKELKIELRSLALQALPPCTEGKRCLGRRRHCPQEILDDFFVHRIQALAEELLGVLVNPILLWFCLAPAASDIVSVMRSLQHSTENLGDWCVYGCLDTARVRENEKLEKSALSFLLNHQLLWSPDESSYDCMPSEFHSCEVQMKAFQPLENEALEWHADGPPLDTPNTWHAEGDARDRRDVAHILGTPSSALSLLQNVQDFQKRAMLENPRGENYGLLPSELVQVPEINPGAPANDAIARAAKMVVEEQRQELCALRVDDKSLVRTLWTGLERSSFGLRRIEIRAVSFSQTRLGENTGAWPGGQDLENVIVLFALSFPFLKTRTTRLKAWPLGVEELQCWQVALDRREHEVQQFIIRSTCIRRSSISPPVKVSARKKARESSVLVRPATPLEDFS